MKENDIIHLNVARITKIQNKRSIYDLRMEKLGDDKEIEKKLEGRLV